MIVNGQRSFPAAVTSFGNTIDYTFDVRANLSLLLPVCCSMTYFITCSVMELLLFCHYRRNCACLCDVHMHAIGTAAHIMNYRAISDACLQNRGGPLLVLPAADCYWRLWHRRK